MVDAAAPIPRKVMTNPSEEAVTDGSMRERNLFARLAAENMALRCLMGGGCDANEDGLHSIVKNASGEFCSKCGEMTRNGKSKPWFDEARLERTVKRLASLTTEVRDGR